MIMKSTYHHKLGWPLLAVAILLLGSCSKSFLNTAPSDGTPSTDALSTESGMQTALMGAYSGLKSINLYGGSLPIIGDLMADNVYVNPNNFGYYIPQYTYSVTVQDATVSSLWADAYTVILRCNNVINDPLPSDAAVNEYKGEAMAIRALMYFYLVDFFAKPYTDDPSSPGVPLVLAQAPAAEPARSTVSQVFTQIVADLKAADTLMTVYTNSSQFSQYAGEGLLAKVYMYMGDSTDALPLAVDVINNSGFTLLTPGTNGANYLSYWAAIAPRTDMVETLMEVTEDKVNNNGVNAVDGQYSIEGYGDFLCSSDLAALYSATDVRGLLLQPDASGNVYVDKYPNFGGPAVTDNSKVLRLSDIYLIAAEASVASNPVNALNYLNTLVAQRDPSLVYASTGSQLTQDIVRERRKELAFEGDRFFDLNRLKWDINRSAQYTPVQSIPYGDYRRVAPIPQTQTLTDPNCVQNSGY
jgi:hypothetical protein